jgi:maltose alpha-D-glucosyltransferase/alpha-amylase
MLDLVVNHTSRHHPWFRSACSDPGSPYRDWYVWSDDEPADRFSGAVFPGVEDQTWTFHSEAGRWYRHRFYHFEPDLNIDNPRVREEIRKIMLFWLRLGVAGFRVDAAPFLIESRDSERREYVLLRRMRETVSWQRRDAILLAEANVPDTDIREYFGHADDEASRAMMMFAFRLNQALMLALARHDATPVRQALAELPDLPREAQWATFLRNHDEVDLGSLSPEEREDVLRMFGPEPDMQIYHRGIRRRMAPMLDGDRRKLELAYSLLLSLPGTPVIRYGDEIGMGDDLSLPERNAVRTPMQWTDTENAGFSSAAARNLVAPVISGGQYCYKKVNVQAQRLDPHSLLTWFERMLHTRRECVEIGAGEHELFDVDVPDVLVHRASNTQGTVLFVHNLSREPRKVSVALGESGGRRPVHLAADGPYDESADLTSLEVNAFGYRWIRLNHTPWDGV